MLNDIETISLKIEEINPMNKSTNVSIDTDIRVKFNSNISKSTVVGNVILFKVNEDNEERVSCNIIVKDNSVVLIPKEKLLNASNYKVLIPKNGVSDILGRRCLIDFSYTFTTASEKSAIKPKLIEPTDSKIYHCNPNVKFISESETNLIQISTNKSFTSIVYEKLLNTESNFEQSFEIENALEEGIYYIRIKNEYNIFSDYNQFYISLVNGKVSDEDYSEEVSESELFEPLNLIKASQDGKIVTNNLNCIDFIFEGKIDTSLLDISNNYLLGESVKDEFDEDFNPQGYLSYNLVSVYDDLEDKTYIMYVLNSNDNENDEDQDNQEYCLTNDDLLSDEELSEILSSIFNESRGVN